jgi:hypothetical protein
MMTRTTAFKHRRLIGIGALALLAISPCLLAAQTGYYRWKDDKGQFQATQQPPVDRPSEYVRLSTGQSTPVAPGETVESKEGQAPAKPADNAAPGPLQGVPDQDPAKCKEAQDAQAMLDSHARIREKTASGEYRYLSPEQIAEQKKRAQESIDVYCASKPAQ